MANKIEEKALMLSEPVAKKQNVYVVDVSYKKENGKNVLCYYIDKRGGVGIDECEEFSRAVEALLDERDIIDTEYSLEVSSPGADRKLVKEREFKYYIGREVDVKLYAALDGVKEFSGILKAYDDGQAVISFRDAEKIVPAKDAVYIRLSFKI